LSKKKSNIKKNVHPAFHQSIEYRRTENLTEDRDESETESSKANTNPFYRPPLPSASQFAFSAGSQYAIPPIQPQEQFQISQFSGLNPYQLSLQFPTYPNPNMTMSQVGSFYGQSNFQF
jgi:hypothetical protein